MNILKSNRMMFLFRNKIKIEHQFFHKYSTSSADTNNDMVICRNENGVKNIMLSHPKTRNSLSLEMMSRLVTEITNNQDDPKLRVIVLTSTGPVFSAGHNLKELTTATGQEHHRKVFKTATNLMMSIINSPVPIIAKVNGLAAAAGCQLVATCDIVICSDKSSFSTPGANFGIFCSTPGIAVGRCVPKPIAMHMLLTGLPLSSTEACEAGLVSKVVPVEKLDSEVDQVCEAIKSKSRAVISLGKQFFYKQMSVNIQEAYKVGEDIMINNVNMTDGQEGISSFAMKRKPAWSHTN